MDNLVQYLVVCGLPRAPKLLDPSRAPDDERARDIMDLAVVIGVDTEPPEVRRTRSSFRCYIIPSDFLRNAVRYVSLAVLASV
jgi:hypothetical protein